MATAEEALNETNAVEYHGGKTAIKQELSETKQHQGHQRTDSPSGQCDNQTLLRHSVNTADVGMNDGKSSRDEPNTCEHCGGERHGTETSDSCQGCLDRVQSRDADSVRVGGSGCSSPADSTPGGGDRDLRLPVEASGAWSPSGSRIHFVADSPLTPTRFRSKSEAGTSTNPIHAQAVVGANSARPKERRKSSSASSTGAQSPGSTTAESPRGEPAGSASGSLSLHGTVTRDGEMLSFVADDLLEKIRQSGDPLKAKDRGSSTGSSACPTPSSSHSRTPSLSPSVISSSAIPPVDPSALSDIERHCKRLADNMELMMGHLSSTLQNMSAITVGHTQTYRDAVDKAGVTVDQSVKCMYALIAKCEELNKTMQPVHQLAIQIKSVRRLLEEMEAACK